jgi:hypothetical protein
MLKSLCRHVSVLGAVIWTLAIAIPAVAADCDNDPNNILSTFNCGFDSVTAPWTAVLPATGSHNNADGSPDLGAFNADNATAGVNTQVLSPCVFVPANTGANVYNFGARVKDLNGFGPSCSVIANIHDNPTCTSLNSSFPSTPVTPSALSFTLIVFTAPGQLLSGAFGQLELRCISATDAVNVAWDNAFAGENIATPVELSNLSVE